MLILRNLCTWFENRRPRLTPREERELERKRVRRGEAMGMVPMHLWESVGSDGFED